MRTKLSLKRYVLGPMVTGLLCIAAVGCDQEKARYGTAFDGERAKRGIPALGTNAYSMSDWGTHWVYDFVEKGRTYKDVETRDGEIVSETDTYHSGVVYTNVVRDGVGRFEELKITYLFEAERHGTNAWSAVYWGSNRTDPLSLEAAEKLLGSWGLRRVDAPTPKR